MSAFIVGDDLLDLLVTAGTRGVGSDARLGVFHQGEWHYWSRQGGADDLGAVLKLANYASVNHRYQESTPCGSYQWDGRGITEYLGGDVIPWGQVLMALDCYEYQTCEVPQWDETLAYAVCRAIRRKVCRIIGNECEAEWEWTRQDAQERMEEIRLSLKSEMAGA